MALPVETSDEYSVAKPNLARVRDYWLGGKYHTEADRRFADHAAACAPHIPYQVRAQRALLGRMVRYLIAQGVRQFLDLGSGIPTAGHIHEIAQDSDPAARVVYVDIDLDVAADSDPLLAGHDNAALVQADLRHPDQVLRAPQCRRLLDLSEPLAVLAIATLQHIPDSDDPAGIITAYKNLMCTGSYLAISHYGPDPQLHAGYTMFDQMNLGQRPTVSLRDHTSLAIFFTGLDLIDPGITPIVLWRPDPDDDLGQNPERLSVYAGLGRKP
jgi:hypothetical protein